MDLSLFFALLWRSKRMVLAGVVLAALLAILAYGTPGIKGGKPTLTPHAAQVWQSESRLLISQSDFPYQQSSEANNLAQPLGNLSPVYASLANGSAVQAEIKAKLGSGGTVKATEDIDAAASSFLPFVNLVATAHTKQAAARRAEGAGRIFIAYVAAQQAAAGIPPEKRIELTDVGSGTPPTLIEGKKLSVPILVFLAVLVAVVVMVLIRENVLQSAAKRSQADPYPDGVASDPRFQPVGTNGGDAAGHRPHAAAGHAQQ